MLQNSNGDTKQTPEIGSKTNLQLNAFRYNGQNLRVVSIDGEPWFVAKDLCIMLNITDHKQSANSLDTDEVCKVRLTDSLGREQETLVVNESGMWKLIFRSNKPEAKLVTRWVTHEVLPQIRKGGAYIMPGASVQSQQNIGETLISTKRYISLLEKLERLQESEILRLTRVPKRRPPMDGSIKGHIINMHNSGMNAAQISRILGRSQFSIHQFLNVYKNTQTNLSDNMMPI